MDNERRVNKIHGILVEDSRVPELIKKVDEATPTVVVDSLPLENIKTNAIYAVKKYGYYTSFYGYKLPLITNINTVDKAVLAKLMLKNGWQSAEITEDLFTMIIVMGFLPENLIEGVGILINEYGDNLFKLKIYVDSDLDINKSFEKLDDLYRFLFSEEYAQSAGVLTENFTNTQAKLREHNFVWSEQALPDYQLGVVFTPTYEYYIYNGEEWKSVDNIELVDKLPSSGEVGKVYAVKTGTQQQYRIHFYDKLFEPLNDKNMELFQEEVISKFGDELGIKFVFGGLTGFLPAQPSITVNSTIQCISNLYTNGKFTLSNPNNSNFAKPEAQYPKEFSTMAELQEYLFSEQFTKDIIDFTDLGFTSSDIQKMYKGIGFRYGTDITDDEFGVSFNEVPIYAYYMYTGEKWINLDVDDKPVITKSIKAGSPITTQLEALTFTVDEINLLKNGSELNIDYIINESTICTAHAQNVCAMKFKDVTKIDNTLLTYNLTFNYIFTDTFRFTIIADITNKNNITVSVIQTQTVTKDNTTIPVSAWSEGGNDTYKYSANITSIKNVDTQSTVLVMFDKNGAEGGNFSPYVDTVDGGLTIYAKEKPTKDVSIHVEVFN